MTSTVKKWLGEKGFGFIHNPDGGSDIFVHHSEIITIKRGPKNLSPGQVVSFQTRTDEKGVKAVRVTAA